MQTLLLRIFVLTILVACINGFFIAELAYSHWSSWQYKTRKVLVVIQGIDILIGFICAFWLIVTIL